MTLFIGFLLLSNLIGFSQMGIDKRKASRNKWRIPESRLWLNAFLFGALGTYIGMQFFRHKTQHAIFKFGLPLLSIVEMALVIYIFNYFQ